MMKGYKLILKMIEEVDPNDTAKLDEIDARVWCYLNGHKFAAAEHDRVFVLDENQCEIEKLNGICTLKYTRSRDALKAIRPKYVSVEIFRSICDYSGCKLCSPTYYEVKCQRVATEELAELHAIIQAISYERGLND